MLAYFFLIFSVLFRVVPHAFHFTPVGATLLFFGANRPRKELAIPIALFAGCDFYLTFVRYGFPASKEQFISLAFTFAWYAVALLIGSLLREKKDVLRLAAGSLSASITFFVVSNFGVWVSGLLYPLTLGGLVKCYLMAIPFFRNTMLSDLFFTALLFGIPMAIAAFNKSASEHGGGIAAA
jgi:hypothetical protein